MKQPSLDILTSKVDSKYTLVVAAAKRARQLTEGEKPMVNVESAKPVSVALEEIGDGKLQYERTKTGIK